MKFYVLSAAFAVILSSKVYGQLEVTSSTSTFSAPTSISPTVAISTSISRTVETSVPTISPNSTTVAVSSCIVIVSATAVSAGNATFPSPIPTLPFNFTTATGESSVTAIWNSSATITGRVESPTSMTVTELVNITQGHGPTVSISTSRALTTSVSATVYSVAGQVTTVFPASISGSPTHLPICGAPVFSSGNITSPSPSPSPTNGSSNPNNDLSNGSGVMIKHNAAVLVFGAVAGAALLAL